MWFWDCFCLSRTKHRRTEQQTTVIATYKECFRGAETRMSIGKPLLNYQCYVLDEHMNLLPPGAVGELVIGGVSVSRRYIRV